MPNEFEISVGVLDDAKLSPMYLDRPKKRVYYLQQRQADEENFVKETKESIKSNG